MFGWDDFKEDGKMRDENRRENGREMYLVGREGGRKLVGLSCFLFRRTKLQSLQNGG